MIGALRGRVIEQSGSTIIVEVGGVGYEVLVSGNVLSRISSTSPESELCLLIYTDVRENAISLFGFLEQAEKEVFLLLKKVKGIGSKLALLIVSQVRPEALLMAIGRGETTVLTAVSGIGKKTAERIIVELKEQVGLFAGETGEHETRVRRLPPLAYEGSDSTASDAVQDAVLALEKLGFSSERARRAVQESIASQGPRLGEDAGELLKEALAHL